MTFSTTFETAVSKLFVEIFNPAEIKLPFAMFQTLGFSALQTYSPPFAVNPSMYPETFAPLNGAKLEYDKLTC